MFSKNVVILWYAHMQAVVAFLVVTFFSVSIAFRNPVVRFGRNLVERTPTSPPELLKQLRDLHNSQQKHKKNKNKIGRKTLKNDDFHLSIIL